MFTESHMPLNQDSKFPMDAQKYTDLSWRRWKMESENRISRFHCFHLDSVFPTDPTARIHPRAWNENKWKHAPCSFREISLGCAQRQRARTREEEEEEEREKAEEWRCVGSWRCLDARTRLLRGDPASLSFLAGFPFEISLLFPHYLRFCFFILWMWFRFVFMVLNVWDAIGEPIWE